MFSIASLRTHALAIISAVIFGVLVSGQFYVAAERISGVFPSLADDQDFYLSRIQDFRDGFTMSGNTYLAEHKDAPPMQYLTGEGIEAFILNALDVPTQEALLLFSLFLTPIIFILTYAIFLQLRTPRFFALAGTLLLLCSLFPIFARPISPQFNFIFWLLAVWGMIVMTNRPSWRSVVLESIAIGFLFYLYPYYWTHILAALGLLFVTYLFINRRSAWSFFAITAGAIAIGSGALLLLWENRLHPFYAESMQRLGFITTHFPSGFLLTVLASSAIIIAAFVARKHIYDWKFLAPFALVAGGVIAMNQHIMTGLNMEFSSHYILQITFSSLFLVFAALGAGNGWRFLEGTFVRIALGILLLFAVVPTIGASYAAAERLSADTGLYREQAAFIGWLKKNAAPEEVVYAPELVSLMIPAYTEQNVFFARNANIGFMSQNEVVDRFILQHFRENIDAEFIAQHEREVFGHGFINRYNHDALRGKFFEFFGIQTAIPVHIPENAITNVEARAQQLQSLTFRDAIKPYKIDYVIIDTRLDNQLLASDTPEAMRVFQTERFIVYKNSP